MRVLFVTHNVPRYADDAAGSFVLRLAVALQHAGAHVEIIAPGAPGLPAFSHLHNVAIQRVPYAAEANMTLAYSGTMVEQVRASWRARLALFRLLRAMRRASAATVEQARRDGNPFDIVHAHWWFPAGLALWCLWRHNDPQGSPIRALTMHGSDVRLALRLAPAAWLMRSVLQQFQVVTTVSTWLAERVREAAPRAVVHVAPMPVDVEMFAVPPPGPREGILFVGRLNAQKGIADVLAALEHPSLQGAWLDVVGDGPDREALQARARVSGVASRVRWRGVLSPKDLMRYYQNASVVAMPSKEEGLGLVAVEAQLCGASVVAYDSGGIADVVHPSWGGTLVPLGDVPALAIAIAARLATSPDDRNSADAAPREMRLRFSAGGVAQRYLELYGDARRAASTLAQPAVGAP